MSHIVYLHVTYYLFGILLLLLQSCIWTYFMHYRHNALLLLPFQAFMSMTKRILMRHKEMFDRVQLARIDSEVVDIVRGEEGKCEDPCCVWGPPFWGHLCVPDATLCVHLRGTLVCISGESQCMYPSTTLVMWRSPWCLLGHYSAIEYGTYDLYLEGPMMWEDPEDTIVCLRVTYLVKVSLPIYY